MPTTPVLALPYPTSADTADVPRDIQALAVKLDGYTSLRPPVVAALPGSPVDGQEIYFDAGGGVIWHLRYTAAATGTSKWLFVGGGALSSRVDTLQGTASTVYADVATVGPTVTVPAPGDYIITFGSRMNTAPAQSAATSVQVGATPASDNDGIFAGTNAAGTQLDSGAARQLVKTVAAGAAITMKYRALAAVTNNFGNRWMSVQPQKLG